jgi:hypothetical protein
VKDFVDVRRLTAESVQGRMVLGVIGVARQSWRHSRLRTLAANAYRGLTDASIVERTRLAAVAVAVSATVNVVARLVMPVYSAPGIPIALLVAIAVVAGAVAAAPEAFVVAWRESRFSRSKQR